MRPLFWTNPVIEQNDLDRQNTSFKFLKGKRPLQHRRMPEKNLQPEQPKSEQKNKYLFAK